MKKQHRIMLAALCALLVSAMGGCAFFDHAVNELNGTITGNTYVASFYSNAGEKFMTMSGQKINLKANVVKERVYGGDSKYVETLSSVVSIIIDGKEVENCGSTVIFAEKGLEPDVDFVLQDKIDSSADGFEDNAIIAGVVNRYKNYFGKSRVVVIQSQLGDPICAFSGNEVYWEVCQDLPKTTKLMMDGKALYIHRANFQIIDRDLLD